MIANSHDHGTVFQTIGLAQELGNKNAAGFIKINTIGTREHQSPELSSIGIGYTHLVNTFINVVKRSSGHYDQILVKPLGDVRAFRQQLPEACWYGHAAFLIDDVFVLSQEHVFYPSY